MSVPETAAPTCWIIAFGNPQRGDDGVGPYVAGRLRDAIRQMSGVALYTLPQLDIALLEDIHGADYLIFVDASAEAIDNGLRWSPVTPELNGWAMGSHQLTPTVFLGLLHLLYQSHPTAWVVSVQGRSFDLGEGLSAEARRDAERAAAQIVDWLYIQGIALDGQKNRGKGRHHG
ncbi:MAG: hydrogenase maturation protease [Desulfobacterales bacterium]|nr:hydrogenase maturation protease [Desulfobacterales bacterium]